MQALASLPAAALEAAAGALKHSLKDANTGVRTAAMKALYKMEARALVAHAAAIEACLGDSDEDVRKAAIDALAKLEPSDLEPHTDALKRMLEDPWPKIREGAKEALVRLGVHHEVTYRLDSAARVVLNERGKLVSLSTSADDSKRKIVRLQKILTDQIGASRAGWLRPLYEA